MSAPRVLGENAPLLVSVVEKRSKNEEGRGTSSSFGKILAGAVACALLVVVATALGTTMAKTTTDKTLVLGATPYYENPVYSDQNTDPMTETNVNEIKTSGMTISLHTGCSPHDKLPWTIEDRSEWGNEVGAKIIFKSDTNDFTFVRGLEMENAGCGSYHIHTDELFVGTQFGFALYPKNNATAHSATKDIGCRSESDSDPRCPSWKSPDGENGGLRGGPMEMGECTFQYKYGDVTFYNRVFDGETTDYVWGSCLDTCPSFTRTPYCGKEEVPKIGQVELRKEEKCTPGDYLQANGKCQACPVGHYSDKPNASECQPCAAGTMQPHEGQSECIPCPDGWYQSANGKQYCEACPGARADSSRRKLQGGNFDWSKFGSIDGWEWIQNATETAVNKTENAYDDAKDAMNNTLTSGADAVKQSAKKTSDAISDTFAKTKENAGETKDTADKVVADAKKKANEATDDVQESASSAVNAVKESAETVSQDVKDAAEKTQESVEKATTRDPIENAEDAANGVKKATISAEEAAEDAANAAKKKAENAFEDAKENVEGVVTSDAKKKAEEDASNESKKSAVTAQDASEDAAKKVKGDSDSNSGENSSEKSVSDETSATTTTTTTTTTTKEKQEDSGPATPAPSPASHTTSPSTSTSSSTKRGATSISQCPSPASSALAAAADEVFPDDSSASHHQKDDDARKDGDATEVVARVKGEPAEYSETPTEEKGGKIGMVNAVKKEAAAVYGRVVQGFHFHR